jgi:hypothetical protein
MNDSAQRGVGNTCKLQTSCSAMAEASGNNIGNSGTQR